MDLKELLAIPGVTESCTLRSAVGFMALHGGSQDRATEQIAREAAERSGSSFYAIVQPPDVRVHLTSRLHDPVQSTALHAFLDHVRIAISVHGFGRDAFAFSVDAGGAPVIEPYGPALRGRQTEPLTGVIVGGLNAPLVAFARTLLQDRFPGYHVADERVRLGFHPQNPVNLPPLHGVQLEFPPGLRGLGPYGDRLVANEEEGPAQVVAALVELAAEAAGIVAGTDCRQNENLF